MRLRTRFVIFSFLIGSLLALGACQDGRSNTQGGSPKATLEEEKAALIEFERNMLSKDSIWVNGDLFLLTRAKISNGGDQSSLHNGYYGTRHDTLFFMREVDFAEGCFAQYPILCWNDTIPQTTWLYSSLPERSCKGREKNYQCLYSGRLENYFHVGTEVFYVVRHRIDSSTDAVEIQVSEDSRWPNRMRRAEKTLIVSRLQGVVGVFTNGVKFDVFPF